MPANPSRRNFETVPANGAYPPRPRRIGALWRRALAFLIDFVIVVIIGLVLGYIFFDLFISLGFAGRVVGYLVGLTYFAISESSFGSGRSLGKRLLVLQVVDAHGKLLPIERSIIRYTVFAIPWLVIDLSWPGFLPARTFASPLSLAAFGVFAVSAYLMVFNCQTRQGIHDLVVGGYVVEGRNTGPVAAHRIWKFHWFLAAGIVVLAAVAGIVAQRQTRRGSMPQLFADARQVELLPGVWSARVLRVNAGSHGSQDESLLVEVRCIIPTSDQQALANQVADSVITTDPTIDQYSTLRIVLIRGYDIGIAHGFFSQTYSDTPAHWRQQLFSVPPQLPAH